MVWMLSTAMAATCLLDVGQTRPVDRAVVLIVQTPGVDVSGYATWTVAIERAGMDAWLLACPLQDDAFVHVLEQWDDRRVALLGHGFGGTLAAMVVQGDVTPDALALIGAPLQGTPTALEDWLAHRPLPEQPQSPETWSSAQWNGMDVMSLWLGPNRPAMTPVPPTWLATLQQWGHGGLHIDLRASTLPILAVASGMDNVAPPERMRGAVPPDSFRRQGLLSLGSHDPTHMDLLLEGDAIAVVSKWLKQVLQ